MRKIQLIGTRYTSTFFSVIVFSITFFLAGCAAKNNPTFHSEPSRLFSKEFVEIPAVPAERASIVIYRQPHFWIFN